MSTYLELISRSKDQKSEAERVHAVSLAKNDIDAAITKARSAVLDKEGVLLAIQTDAQRAEQALEKAK